MGLRKLREDVVKLIRFGSITRGSEPTVRGDFEVV